MTEWRSSVLAEQHDVSAFRCGVPDLDSWLCDQALRARDQGTAMTYVWTSEQDNRVRAYYALAPHQVAREHVSSGMAGGISTIPAYLLARLALDSSLHGQGLGGELLHDSLDRIVSAADIASGRLVVVDAIDEGAAAFYRRYDFRPVEDNPLRLVMKISTLRKSMAS